MSTLLASTSQAAAATTTTSSFPFDSAALVTATNVNGSPGPVQGNMVALQLSTDNVNWTEVDRRLFTMGAGVTDIELFWLANYAGNTAMATMSGYNATAVWSNYRLVFSGNQTNAVTVSATTSQGRAVAVVPLVGTTATTGGAIGSWTPPMGGTGIIIERCIANVTTKSTGAANLSAGVAANATTSATNLITASAVGSAAVLLDSLTLQVAATAALALLMTANQSVTFTGSASTAGLVGTAYIEYLLPP